MSIKSWWRCTHCTFLAGCLTEFQLHIEFQYDLLRLMNNVTMLMWLFLFGCTEKKEKSSFVMRAYRRQLTNERRAIVSERLASIESTNVDLVRKLAESSKNTLELQVNTHEQRAQLRHLTNYREQLDSAKAEAAALREELRTKKMSEQQGASGR